MSYKCLNILKGLVKYSNVNVNTDSKNRTGRAKFHPVLLTPIMYFKDFVHHFVLKIMKINKKD